MLLHKPKPGHDVIVAANGCNLLRKEERVTVKNQLVGFYHISSISKFSRIFDVRSAASFIPHPPRAWRFPQDPATAL
jgi:hypothetical protein